MSRDFDKENAEYLATVSDEQALAQLVDEYENVFASLARITAVAKSVGNFAMYEAAYQANSYALRSQAFYEEPL